MFRPEPSIPYVPVTRDQVVAIVESINQPQVSVPGKTPQPVHGHLVGLRTGPASLTLFVGLHLAKTGENVFYVHDKRQLTLDEYRDVEVEALQFLESMGFMLDNLNFRNLPPEAQDATLKRIPLFSPGPGAAPVPASPGAPATGAAPAPLAPADLPRLGRLLASF